MNEAVFISDLHLHPEQPNILEKFKHFVTWAEKNTHSLYILGDFLHVWPGDDALDAWGEYIADLLAKLHDQGVSIFFMAGNRDFLIGERFLKQAKMHALPDPVCIQLGNTPVVLSHGDAYCTRDRGHQWFRRLTRNPWFKRVFLTLPFPFRSHLVNQVRRYSQNNIRKPSINMQTIPEAMQKDVKHFSAQHLIHGHTHQPGAKKHPLENGFWTEYTLSDWDENPSVLCYNQSNYQFILINEDM